MPKSPGAVLRAFLGDPRRPADTLRYHELQGFLFAVASAPELVKPSEWMPIVFGDREPEYASLEEAREVIGQLMAVYNAVNATVAEHRAALPTDCAFRSDPIANLDDDAPVAQWSRGFLRGHQWLEESWESYIPAELDDDFAAMLMTLSFFAVERPRRGILCRDKTGSREDGRQTSWCVCGRDHRVRALRPFDSLGSRGA